MWQRCFLNEFPTLLILLSFPSHWQRADVRSWLLQIDVTTGTEYPDHPVPNLIPSKLGSMPPLVGRAPPSAAWRGLAEETGGGHTPRVPTSQQRGRSPKTCPVKDDTGNLLQSSPERGGMDSDGYSTVSKAQSTCHCRRRW